MENPPPSSAESDDLPENNANTRLAGWQLAGLLVVTFLVGLAAGYLAWGYPMQAKLAALESQSRNAQSTAVSAANAANQAAADAQDPVQIPENVKRYNVPTDGDPQLGPDNAPITIIEFSDYQCPFCRKWQLETFPVLLQKYGEKIRFVYRDYPLYDKHPEAEPAAEAAECAGEQKKYFDFHNLLFQGDSLSADLYEQYAKQLNLNLDQFHQCLSEHRYQNEIKADSDFANGLGISSTPTFFINGLALVGAQPASVFEQVIDLELAGKIPR